MTTIDMDALAKEIRNPESLVWKHGLTVAQLDAVAELIEAARVALDNMTCHISSENAPYLDCDCGACESSRALAAALGRKR